MKLYKIEIFQERNETSSPVIIEYKGLVFIHLCSLSEKYWFSGRGCKPRILCNG